MEFNKIYIISLFENLYGSFEIGLVFVESFLLSRVLNASLNSDTEQPRAFKIVHISFKNLEQILETHFRRKKRQPRNCRQIYKAKAFLLKWNESSTISLYMLIPPLLRCGSRICISCFYTITIFGYSICAKNGYRFHGSMLRLLSCLYTL